MPIAVEVADGVPLEPTFLVFLDVMLPEVALAVVLEPVKVALGGVGTGQVEVTVAVEIGSGDGVGVFVVSEDKFLGEPDRATVLVANGIFGLNRAEGEKDGSAD